jgi:hypothetical protein
MGMRNEQSQNLRKYSGTPYSKMSSGTPQAHRAASILGPDALVTLLHSGAVTTPLFWSQIYRLS